MSASVIGSGSRLEMPVFHSGSGEAPQRYRWPNEYATMPCRPQQERGRARSVWTSQFPNNAQAAAPQETTGLVQAISPRSFPNDGFAPVHSRFVEHKTRFRRLRAPAWPVADMRRCDGCAAVTFDRWPKWDRVDLDSLRGQRRFFRASRSWLLRLPCKGHMAGLS